MQGSKKENNNDDGTPSEMESEDGHSWMKRRKKCHDERHLWTRKQHEMNERSAKDAEIDQIGFAII